MNVLHLPPRGERLFPLLFLSNNLISRIGILLVTTATVFWLFLLPTYLSGHAGSAYIGIVLFLMLPGFFFLGLALIPIGILLRRKRLGPGTAFPPELRVMSWSNPALRHMVTFVALATGANLVIGASLTYRAVEHMEGVQFCGATCHTVMKPEFTAHGNSPHSRVACVACHIGPGASWFVQSKLSGVRQVFAVALNTYERPIAVPVANLRPARETCEGCHWPAKYGGDRLKVIPHFNDEGVLTKSVLLMHIGGGAAASGGIHNAHMGTGVQIRYASDASRQNIPWVEYSRNGEKHEFLATSAKKEEVAGMATRPMDCMDCHNRPSHTFEMPERALDNAMAAGDVKADLPRVRKTALDLLKKSYPSTAQAESEIPAAIEKFYREQNPDIYAARKGDVSDTAKAVLGIWQRNIFPEMNITWGTYPNNLGHNDFPGCFRCHDSNHKTADGKKAIEQDCASCHAMLAMEEAAPQILKDLGLH